MSLIPAPGAFRRSTTIARGSDGRLVGYNTDGAGFVESLLRRQRIATKILSRRSKN